MKKTLLTTVILLATVSTPTFALSISELACGAKICLSGDGGSPCDPFLDKYFSIKVKKDGKLSKKLTERARKKFLAKCDETSDSEVQGVKNQILGSAGS